jgi:hypothetical protein
MEITEHFFIDNYDETKYFGVYAKNGELVCVTVYKRGAREVVKRLEELHSKIHNLEKERNK